MVDEFVEFGAGNLLSVASVADDVKTGSARISIWFERGRKGHGAEQVFVSDSGRVLDVTSAGKIGGADVQITCNSFSLFPVAVTTTEFVGDILGAAND